ncbi:MAG: ABC transporter permease [Nitrososphaerales archaeon]
MSKAPSPNTDVSLEGNVLPTSMQQIGTVVKYEMTNYFRSRRFFILLIIGLIVSGLLTFLVAYYGVSTFGSSAIQFYSAWWQFAPTFVVIFSAIFFGGDAISGEFQNKTGYFLVGNPIRRSSIYIGKWVAAFTAAIIIMAVFTAIAIANGAYYFGGSAFPSQFGQAVVFTIVYLIAALGFTFFFSSLFKSSSMSILVTVILLLFGFSIIDTLVTSLVHIEPWFILTYGSAIITGVLSAGGFPAHQTVEHFGRVTITTYNATIPEGLAIMLVYFAITAILGLVLFERKEFN